MLQVDEHILRMDIVCEIKMCPTEMIKCRFIEANKNNKKLYIGLHVLFMF